MGRLVGMTCCVWAGHWLDLSGRGRKKVVRAVLGWPGFTGLKDDWGEAGLGLGIEGRRT
jgi:hypothetical protein